MTTEQDAFLEEMYAQHGKRMFEVSQRIVKNPTVANDIVAETFLILTVNIDKVIRHADPVKWMYTVLKNAALGECRRRKARAESPLDEAMLKAVETPFIGFRDGLPGELSPEERFVLTVRFEQDMDYAEMAKRLGVSESACRMKVSRAKQHCAKLMEEENKKI